MYAKACCGTYTINCPLEVERHQNQQNNNKLCGQPADKRQRKGVKFKSSKNMFVRNLQQTVRRSHSFFFSSSLYAKRLSFLALPIQNSLAIQNPSGLVDVYLQPISLFPPSFTVRFLTSSFTQNKEDHEEGTLQCKAALFIVFFSFTFLLFVEFCRFMFKLYFLMNHSGLHRLCVQ